MDKSKSEWYEEAMSHYEKARALVAHHYTGPLSDRLNAEAMHQANAHAELAKIALKFWENTA